MTADGWLTIMRLAAAQDVEARTGTTADLIRVAKEWQVAVDDPNKTAESVGAAFDKASAEWHRLLTAWAWEHGRAFPGSPDEFLALAVEAGLPAESVMRDEFETLATMAVVEGFLRRKPGDEQSVWSKARPPSEWLRMLKKLGDEMSLRTFHRRRGDRTFIEHPASTSKLIRLRLDTLPEGYSDSLK